MQRHEGPRGDRKENDRQLLPTKKLLVGIAVLAGLVLLVVLQR